jgi:hypothetical protein
MARHAQPRAVAELKGATKKNPQRYRKQPPKSELGVGNVPARFDAAQQQAWLELTTYAPVGVLAGADRLTIEVGACLLAQFREDSEAFPANKIGHLIGILARLGMSPADRQKLGTEKAPEGNPFDQFN